MTVEQPPLWSDDWAIEPCDTEQAVLDLHGPQPEHRAYRNTVTVDLQGDLL
ncbi:hypothetical protein [Streptomyces sp. NPDC048272]|uniref:hypothetical protein n=1 Tax=Streptomyces sp. NPDC048272 TaxID=3154616 RepID=UPI00343C2793